MILDTSKQLNLVGNVFKRHGSNSIVMGCAKKMEIVWVVATCFGMLTTDGSKFLFARLIPVMLFVERYGVCT